MGGSSKAPKPPKPTAQEKAIEKRTNIGLRRERMQTERMLKAQARGQLGAKSLLTGLKRDTSLKQEDVVHSKRRNRPKLRGIFAFARKMGGALNKYQKAKIFNEQKARGGQTRLFRIDK